MTFQTTFYNRLIGGVLFVLPIMWFVFGIISKTSDGCSIPYLEKNLAPEIWCCVLPIAAGFMVVTTNDRPTYQKFFWTMLTSWIATLFITLALSIELYTLYYLLVTGDYTRECMPSSVNLVLGSVFFILCPHMAIKFGIHYKQSKTTRRTQGVKAEMAISSETGATLVKIGVLAIILSIPAVSIAYGQPYDMTYLARVGAGIWCSVLCIVAGALCYKSLQVEANGMTTATFAFGIIGSFFATCQLGVEVGAAVQCLMYQDQYPQMATTFQLHMLIAICAVFQLALSIYIAVTFGKMSNEMMSKIKYYTQNYQEKMKEHLTTA